MIQAVGNLTQEQENLVKKVFSNQNLDIEFTAMEELKEACILSFTKEATKSLGQRGISFFNWDLLFAVLGPHDTEGEVTEKINKRVEILKSVLAVRTAPVSDELHGSIRVSDLAKSAGFYTWLFGVSPKEWTHRYITFTRSDTKFNFVLLVSDGKELHQDTLYHLGMGVSSKKKVIEFYNSALENGFQIEKPPRTTWRGTPLHELWLRDPDGTLIEIYSRLSNKELNEMPKDKEPLLLV